MIETLRWISLAMLWVAIAVNVYMIIRNSRTHKKLKEACATMEKLIRNWEEDHAGLEEDSDGDLTT